MLKVYIGWDSREPIAYDVCENSILRHSSRNKVQITPIKHREMRELGLFSRPWEINARTGNFRDLIDGRPFSTEFSHTRFLTPILAEYKGWAIFMDCDMIALNDITEIMKYADEKYAVMVRKHNHRPTNNVKMDNREQYGYERKNWSSFILFNCKHPSNAALTPQLISTADGSFLHQFGWLRDSEIGDLPSIYNWIEGISSGAEKPHIVHYTDGGPWFIDNPKCQDVLFAKEWWTAYERYISTNDKFQYSPYNPFARKRLIND